MGGIVGKYIPVELRVYMPSVVEALKFLSGQAVPPPK
jgi:hypothetical protein